MPTRSAAKVAMRERILEVADRLFYRHGIRVVGVDMIAAEIGISKRTFNNYFASKDDLIVRVLLTAAGVRVSAYRKTSRAGEHSIGSSQRRP